MEALQQKMTYRTQFFVLAVILAVSMGSVFADDLNPPPYRGDPLSVFVHWSGQTDLPQPPEWDRVDDDDPSTILFFDLVPQFTIMEDPTGLGLVYEFSIPNFVDELPLKLLRVQLTWQGTTQPPIGIEGVGFDGSASGPGVVTSASTPLVFTQPDGGYQYFDIEFRPNPDFEILHVTVPNDAQLVQVVVDSISTVPEPATLTMLAAGSMVLLFIHRKR